MKLTHSLTRPDRPEETIQLYISGSPREGNVECVCVSVSPGSDKPEEERWTPDLSSARLANDIWAKCMDQLGWTVEPHLD